MNRAIVIISLAFLANGATAQEESIVGAYRVNLSRTVELMQSLNRQKYDDLSAESRQSANESIASKRFTFSNDGVVAILWHVRGVEKSAHGNWQLDGTTLMITIEGQLTQFIITHLDGHSIQLNNPSGKGLFNSLILERDR